MRSWPRTVGFGAILLSSTVLIHYWCRVVSWRFKTEHPDAIGTAITHFCWDHSWASVLVAAVLALVLCALHSKGSPMAYEITYYVALWLLVVWCGFALIAMEVCFVPMLDLRGYHY